MRTRLAVLGCVGILLSLSGCGVTTRTVRKTFYEPRKTVEPLSTVLAVPHATRIAPESAEPTGLGVEVRCETTPFEVRRTEQRSRELTYADPLQPGFDFYVTRSLPICAVVPDRLQFHVTIRNNQDRVIKLQDVPVILLLDGTPAELPESTLVEWAHGMIVKGFAKEISIEGPPLDRLQDAHRVHLGIHDVPVAFDPAGNVTRKHNFEWTFEITQEELAKEDQIVYSYDSTPVETRPCQDCGGDGVIVKGYSKCGGCSGTGVVKGKACAYCNGAGKVPNEFRCGTCDGNGSLAFPKSKLPPVLREELWTGWKVRVETIPPGAQIQYFDLDQRRYAQPVSSPESIPWFSCESEFHPIIVMRNGTELRLAPFDSDAKKSNKILVDFTSDGGPMVTGGVVK